jgi:hypothetical protein
MGEPVNHQYDKAFPWELDAHRYTRLYISQGIYYFSGESLLQRPYVCSFSRVSESQIVLV